jgi:hypothetical protein
MNCSKVKEKKDIKHGEVEQEYDLHLAAFFNPLATWSRWLQACKRVLGVASAWNVAYNLAASRMQRQSS